MSIKAIFFDNDGTISDTTECILYSMNHVVNEVFKKNVDVKDFLKNFGRPNEFIFNDFVDK